MNATLYVQIRTTAGSWCIRQKHVFERLWQRVEKEQVEVEDITAAVVDGFDAGDVLPPLSSVDEVWFSR